MSDTWSAISVLTYLGLLVAAGVILLYVAVRRRSFALVVVCAALVLWPIAGDFVNGIAGRHALESVRVGYAPSGGMWQDSPGGFITKVAWLVHLVQATLALTASILLVRLLQRERSR